MKNNFTLRWTLANALGMSLGFLAFIQFLMFYGYGLNFEKHWVFGTDAAMSENAMLIGIGIGLAVFGSVFSLGQAIILKQYLPKLWAWVLNGALGYIVVLLIIWPFIGIWGRIEGPVEPFTVVVGGTLFMLILQWRYLTKQGIKPARPLIWFGAGFLLGIIPLLLLFMVIGLNVPWAAEVAIMGLTMGGLAGFLSAKHFQKELEERNI
jgi:hypothetical protein